MTNSLFNKPFILSGVVKLLEANDKEFHKAFEDGAVAAIRGYKKYSVPKEYYNKKDLESSWKEGYDYGTKLKHNPPKWLKDKYNL